MGMNSVKDKSPKTFGDEMTPLHFAAIQGHLETCRFIISQVQDKNPRDKNGNTPLHSAAGGLFSTSLEICRLILENIEEKNPQNEKGGTPLQRAEKNPKSSVVYQFLKETLEKGKGH